MAKIRNPVSFSEHFGVDEDLLSSLGVLNPTLNVDTRLFIDPLLLSSSSHIEISAKSRAIYVEHFNKIIRLFKISKQKEDVAWRNARRLMEFPEIKWTCLGYGANSVAGSGSGTFITDEIIKTAKEIVDLGITDPDLFVAMGIFEEGIGPDRISDMTSNVILPGLLEFNQRVLGTLSVPTKQSDIILRNGNSYSANLPVNPFGKGNQPIILVPSDILRVLPIVNDWSEVADAASKNAALRRKVNEDIGHIWHQRTLKDKSELRHRVLANHDAFETFLDMLHNVEKKPYDLAADPAGELVWRKIAQTIAQEQPLTLAVPEKLDIDGITSIVEKIIDQFRFLIEERRLSEELYHEGKPRFEKSAQRLFFAVAYAYCKANDLDITPEAETGNGPVDFKVSNGFTGRVLVEIKLSTNGKVVAGYSRQLEMYKNAEETVRGFYVVIDVGSMGNKRKDLIKEKNAKTLSEQTVSPIIFIDGGRRLSASKL